MANHSIQIGQVITKLYSKTASGEQSWKQSHMNGKYQARFGDYTVEISGNSGTTSITSILGTDASIKITKLNGDVVSQAGGGNNVARGLAQGFKISDPLDSSSQHTLNNLYALVSDRSDDLDELLSLI